MRPGKKSTRPCRPSRNNFHLNAMAKPFKIKKVTVDDPIRAAAVRILLTRLKEFYSHWPSPDQLPAPEELHNLRISGKRLRYSAEMLRDYFSDHLALLIELLKRSQDILGDYQDCVTHRQVFEADLKRLRKRAPAGEEIPLLEKILAEYEAKQQGLFNQYRDVWRGMTLKEFRKTLKTMLSTPWEEAPPVNPD